jgi:hypothetical protein
MNLNGILVLLKLFEESGLTPKKTPPAALEEIKKFHKLGLKIPDELR